MRNWHIPLKVIGGLLIALGLLISVAAAASAIMDARQAALLSDQVDNLGQTSTGFDPIIVPQPQAAGPWVAPTLLPQTSGQNGNLQNPSLAGGILVSTPMNWQDPAAAEGPPPTATAVPIWIPDRIVIPAIKLDAPVVPAILNNIKIQGKLYQQWVPPNSYAAGRLITSASLGVVGNTVLIGHHNVLGEVFRHLVDLQVGDWILVYSGDKEFAYVITLRMILPERDQPLDVRLKNAQWIAPSQDERLTLVTCWPYTNNTHRLVIVATPANPKDFDPSGISPRPTARSISP